MMRRNSVILLCLCCCLICIVCSIVCSVSVVKHQDSSEEFSIIGRWKVDSFVMNDVIIDAQNIPAKYDEYGLDYYSNYYYVFNADGSAIHGVLENHTAGDYTIENTIYGTRIVVYIPEFTETVFLFVEDDLIIDNSSFMTIRFRKE